MHGPLNVKDWMLVVREYLEDLGVDWVTVLEWMLAN